VQGLGFIVHVQNIVFSQAEAGALAKAADKALSRIYIPQVQGHQVQHRLGAAARLAVAAPGVEAVLDDDEATEPEKAEALAELEQVYEFQKKHAMRSRGNAEKLVRAVRVAITRFHKHLEAATDGKAQPHPVLRPFADHLAKYLITPSARFNGRMGAISGLQSAQYRAEFATWNSLKVDYLSWGRGVPRLLALDGGRTPETLRSTLAQAGRIPAWR
jgi:hypothetical protein